MIYTILRTITIFFNVLNIAIFIRCFLSWLPLPRENQFVAIIIGVTEPILGPIRKLFQKSPIGGGAVDFSPIIALFLLNIVQRFIINIAISLFL